MSATTSRAARMFTTKPSKAAGHLFRGTWASFLDIERWLPYGGYWVPQGYEHHLRTEREHDRSNGHILGDAPAFMVVYLDEERTDAVRVYRSQWILSREDAPDLVVLDEKDLVEIYVDVSTVAPYTVNA